MFKDKQQAFNYYRTQSVEDMETRAAEISGEVEHDAEADVTQLKIEAKGLEEAIKNAKDKARDNDNEKDDDEDMENRSQFNPITGRNFNDEVPTENIFESKEYRSAFFKTMLGHELNDIETRTFNHAMNETRADDFNTTGNSAAVLPTETLNEVISKARKEGGLLSVVRNFNLPTNISVPIGTPADKAEWHEEGKEVAAEQVETTRIKFGSHEVMKVFSMSVSTKKMSIQAFESYLIDELTATVLEAIEDAIVNGDGDGKGEGLLNIDFENEVDFGGEYKDFANAMAALKKGYSKNAKWAMNNATLYGEVYGLVDDSGRPVFIDDPKNESIGRILGKEVIVDDHIEDGVIVLGDFEYYGVNIPDGIMVETSRESSFRSGLVDYRAIAIADCKPLVEEAFVKLEGEDTP